MLMYINTYLQHNNEYYEVKNDSVHDLHSLKQLLLLSMRSDKVNFSRCCAASVASKQQYKQDLRKIYRRGDEFSN